MPVCSRNPSRLPISAILRPMSNFIENRVIETNQNENVVSKVWNLKKVKADVRIQCNRTFQKLSKIMSVESTINNEIEEDRSHGNVIESLRTRNKLLNELVDQLGSVKSTNGEAFSALLPLIISLGFTPGDPPAPVVKRVKAPTPSPRLPYHVYKSADDIEIWVGRTAEENDDLSCNPKLRHNEEWWLHVAGHSGSHVVIKCSDNDLPEKYRQTVLDAAYLAAVNSKSAVAAGGRTVVSLTRCRNVKKPKGAVAGLVQLSGDIMSVSVTLKKETDRRDRLKKM